MPADKMKNGFVPIAIETPGAWGPCVLETCAGSGGKDCATHRRCASDRIPQAATGHRDSARQRGSCGGNAGRGQYSPGLTSEIQSKANKEEYIYLASARAAKACCELPPTIPIHSQIPGLPEAHAMKVPTELFSQSGPMSSA